MQRDTIIILEDNLEHVREFEDAVASLGSSFRARIWHDAPTMIAECPAVLPQACLISIDHYLDPMPGGAEHPGSGLDVVRFLARKPAVCPVILHTSSSNHAWPMYTILRDRLWYAEMVLPSRKGWIHEAWLPRVRILCSQSA